MSDWTRDNTHVHWVQGGLLVQFGSVVLAIDAPMGIADRITPHLGHVQGIVLSSGRMASVRGLLALMEATSRARTTPFTVIGPAMDERIPAIVEVWTRGWQNRVPIHIDALPTNEPAFFGEIQVRLQSVAHGEPNGQHPEGIERVPGCAVQIQTPDTQIVWVPGAAPNPSVRRAIRGADLAIVEVGVVPWPQTEQRWRLTLTEALEAAQDAETVWVVGDDGQRISGAQA